MFNEYDMIFRDLADIAPTLIWACDAQGETVFFNKAWLYFTGRTLEKELGTWWTERIHPDDYAHCYRTMNVALEDQHEFKIEYRMKYRDGSYRWVVDHVVPRFHPDHSFAGFAGFCTDITMQKLANKAEEEQRAFAEALANTTLALTSSINLDKVLDEMIDQLEKLFHHDATNIMLRDGEILYAVRWNGYEKFGSDPFIEKLRHGLTAFPTDRQAVETRKPVVIADTQNHPQWITIPQTAWIRSHIVAPIFYGDHVLGMLRLTSAAPNFFTERDAERLIPLTNIAAIALINAQIYAQAQREITERKRAEEAVRTLNQQLEQRVDERTAALAAANERLQHLDRLKSQFVADVSHELRTPITVLSLKLELLQRKPEKLLEHLPELEKQVDQLTTLVSDILDISRLELGRDKVNFTTVNVNELAEQVVAAHREHAETADLSLTFTPCETTTLVRGERNQLAQVITNLLANAIKYTTEGSVQVVIGRDEQRVYIEVCDSGSGIPADDLPHLFERFYRGRPTGSLGIPGTGLGLSMVKEIVDIHGGDIDIESQLGQGSTFRVWLPRVEEEKM